jgi:hypothetical protein
MKTIMEKRPEFRLILMSATIDLSQFEDYFKRFEEPRLNSTPFNKDRWDNPLFELRYMEELPLEAIVNTILF